MSRLVLVLAIALGVVGVAVARSQPAGGVRRNHLDPAPAIAGVVVLSIVFALTGWLLPALVLAGGAAFGVRQSRRRGRRDPDSVERVEALASWVENLRDVLRAGHQPVGAIAVTVETCPAPIRPQVRALSARLAAGHGAEHSVRRFADEVDDPLADLVSVGLLVAITRGAETEGVLSSLASQTRHAAERRRIVDAERAPVQREVQMVSVVMCLLLAGLLLFGRSSYLDAYDDASGQVVLATVLVAYCALVVWVVRLTRFPRPGRFVGVGDQR